jgi:ubiquinone/menaquinone biosynthesis C-methylase UbiE
MKTELAPIIKFSNEYHEKQFERPYQSSIDFFNWLESVGVIKDSGQNILDVGCGMGANIYYAAQRFKKNTFAGLDNNPGVIESGIKQFSEKLRKRCELSVGDIYDLANFIPKNTFDGVISLQTLSWLNEHEKAIKAMASLSPKYIALTSLFYDGPIEAMTCINEFDNAGNKIQHMYNTYSLTKIRELFSNLGYNRFQYTPFHISIDLQQTTNDRMQTYTETLESGRRLQISGPLLMNWYFVLAQQ